MVAEWDSSMLAMDERTTQLILQIQMEDMAQFKENSKGKGRADEKTDADFALELYKQELEENAAIISDRLMSRSIAHAVQTDGRLLSGAFEKEDLTARDHAAAVSGEIPDLPTPLDDSLIPEAQIMNDEVLEKLAAKYVSRDGGCVTTSETLTKTQKGCMDSGESSAWAGARQRLISTKGGGQVVVERSCVSCDDKIEFFDLARVPCGHEYCRACLQELFRLAMGDESLFPPRCCRQHITVGMVVMWLDKELAVAFSKKKIEFDTPNRTYCSNKACSTFIRVQNIANDIATCASCGTRTCAMCKSPAHCGDCPNDTALQQVLAAADENKWQRCYSCFRVVELSMGCNHITCRCGAHFCYVCGEKWRTCGCLLWDEDRLLGRANHLVNRAVRRLREGVAAVAQNVGPVVRAQPPPLPVAVQNPIHAPEPAPKQHLPLRIAGGTVQPQAPVRSPTKSGTNVEGGSQKQLQKNTAKSHTSSPAGAKLLTSPSPAVAKAIPAQSPPLQQTSGPAAVRSSSVSETLEVISGAKAGDKKTNNTQASGLGLPMPSRTQPNGVESSKVSAFKSTSGANARQAEASTPSASSSSKAASTKTSTSVSKPTVQNTVPSTANKFMRQDVSDKKDTTTSAVSTKDRSSLIADAVQRLLANHECEHRKWKFVHGEHQCEECRQWLPMYIFECQQCEVQACNRCRRNRL